MEDPLAASGAVIHSRAFGRVGLPIAGSQIFRAGKVRDGRVPLVAPAADVRIPAIAVSTLACACIRGVAAKTCGGYLFEANGAPARDCTDGYTNGESICAGHAPCTAVYGPGNTSAGWMSCGAEVPADVSVVQEPCWIGPFAASASGDLGVGACNDFPTWEISGASQPGSMLLYRHTAIGSVVGSCNAYCTDADPYNLRGTPTFDILTTSSSSVHIGSWIGDHYELYGSRGSCAAAAPISWVSHAISLDPTSASYWALETRLTTEPFSLDGAPRPSATRTPTPTSTSTISATPSESATPTPALVVSISNTRAETHGLAEFDVSLAGAAATQGVLINNLGFDIIVSDLVFDVTSTSHCEPDSRLPALYISTTLPPSPNPGPNNRRLRFLLVDTTEPFGKITDGRLFRCSLPVRSAAPLGVATLVGVRAYAGGANGSLLPIRLSSGSVEIVVGPTPSPTPTRSLAPTSTVTRGPTPCTGDCDLDGRVRMADLRVAVGRALGHDLTATCVDADRDRDGSVTVDEVVVAVNNAVYGCGVPVPTPRPPARFVDNRDGTITDRTHGLRWEKKVAQDGVPGGLHDVDNSYLWAGECSDILLPQQYCQPTVASSSACTAGGGGNACAMCPDGRTCVESRSSNNADFSTIWGWVAQLNAERFADYEDWRIPTLEELANLDSDRLAFSESFDKYTACKIDRCPMIRDPNCSCTRDGIHWSRTRSGSDRVYVRYLGSLSGPVEAPLVLGRYGVRAVRGGS